MCCMSTTITGEDVKALRLALGLTQAAFGKRIGVSVVTVGRWETEVCTPSPMAQVQLERLLAKQSKKDSVVQPT